MNNERNDRFSLDQSKPLNTLNYNKQDIKKLRDERNKKKDKDKERTINKNKLLNKDKKYLKQNYSTFSYYDKIKYELNNKEYKNNPKEKRINKNKEKCIGITKRTIQQKNSNQNDTNFIQNNKNVNLKNEYLNQIGQYIDNNNKLKMNLTNKSLNSTKKKSIDILNNFNNYNLHKKVNVQESIYDSINNYDYIEENNNYFKKLSKEKVKNLDRNKTIAFNGDKNLIMNKLINNQQLNYRMNDLSNSNDNSNPISVNQNIINGYKKCQTAYRIINNKIPNSFTNNKYIE